MASLELLLMLGTSEVIAVIEQMLTLPTYDFGRLKSTLTTTALQTYDESAFLKNRFLRDHKDELRHRLIDLEAEYPENLRFLKRIELVRRALRFGPTNIDPGEVEETK
jgi:hypothetical protein